MKIETKYNVGDTAYLIPGVGSDFPVDREYIIEVTIRGIEINVDKKSTEVGYKVFGEGVWTTQNTEELAPTREQAYLIALKARRDMLIGKISAMQAELDEVDKDLED